MEIYVLRNGQKMGPYTPDEVRSSLAAGSVQPTDLGWQEGEPEGWLVGANKYTRRILLSLPSAR